MVVNRNRKPCASSSITFKESSLQTIFRGTHLGSVRRSSVRIVCTNNIRWRALASFANRPSSTNNIPRLAHSLLAVPSVQTIFKSIHSSAHVSGQLPLRCRARNWMSCGETPRRGSTKRSSKKRTQHRQRQPAIHARNWTNRGATVDEPLCDGASRASNWTKRGAAQLVYGKIDQVVATPCDCRQNAAKCYNASEPQAVRAPWASSLEWLRHGVLPQPK